MNPLDQTAPNLALAFTEPAAVYGAVAVILLIAIVLALRQRDDE